MASPIPAALKSADISRFALRAAQLEKAKPIIAYWSNYWIINQIISRDLQNADEESKQYTMNIMDKLEKFKSEHPDEDAITDDMTGKAYIEQFGLDTFQRADNAVRANKASRQTADTFQASATFLELLQVFGPLDPEIASKIKYAKFHALRIAKALKAGEDPNLSNPKPEPEPEEQAPPLDQSDMDLIEGSNGTTRPRQPSVQEVPDEADRIQKSLAQKSILDESLHPSRSTSVPRPPGPKLEEVPDEADRLARNMARQSSLDESLHPSRAPSVPRIVHADPTSGPTSDPTPKADGPNAEDFYSSAPEVADSDSPTGSGDRKPSVGGNYFPRIPSPPSVPPGDASEFAPPPDLPSAPQDFTTNPAPPSSASVHAPIHPQPPTQPPPFLPPHTVAPSMLPTNPPPNPVTLSTPQFYQTNSSVPSAPSTIPEHQTVPDDIPTAADEEAIMKAQKHARWAISALNFEDVATAVKELRGALTALGAK